MKRYGLLFLTLLLVFALAMGSIRQQQARHSREILEDALRRSAVSCYACEGFYPPNPDYLREHYGFVYDESRYVIHYQFTASNLMPDIAVMEVQP